MEVKELVEIINKERLNKIDEINYLKNNINSSYTLAKLDFIVIDNKTDFVETLDDVLTLLENLQMRIISRNKK